jgi:hypothetical protein
MPTPYLVRWEITLEADTPEEAAQKALDIQRAPDSIATVFKVRDPELKSFTTVDLTPDED